MSLNTSDKAAKKAQKNISKIVKKRKRKKKKKKEVSWLCILSVKVRRQ